MGRILLKNGGVLRSQVKTKRLEIMQRALGSDKRLRTVDELAHESKRQILKGIPDRTTAKLSGIDVTGTVANELARNLRVDSHKSNIIGTYKILQVNTESAVGFSVRLRNIITGEEFTASFADEFYSAKNIDTVQKAEWASQPIQCEIVAKTREGKIISAQIFKVSNAASEPQSD